MKQLMTGVYLDGLDLHIFAEFICEEMGISSTAGHMDTVERMAMTCFREDFGELSNEVIRVEDRPTDWGALLRVELARGWAEQIRAEMEKPAN